MKAPFLLIGLSTALAAEEIPLGIEAVTGIRSDYVHRGFRLSSTALEFQLEAEIAKNKDTIFHFGAWYLAGGSDDFRESGIYLDFEKRLGEHWTLGSTVIYRDYQNTFFESGLELEISAAYRFNEDWDFESSLAYDFGASGWYGESVVIWSQTYGKKTFLTTEAGLSYTSGYYGRSGANDLFGRATLTYALSDTIAFSPYLGLSIPLDEGSEEGYLGLNFEVLF